MTTEPNEHGGARGTGPATGKQTAAETIRGESQPDHEEHRTPGTFVLVLVLLLSFAVYYFANWKALSDVWQVR